MNLRSLSLGNALRVLPESFRGARGVASALWSGSYGSHFGPRALPLEHGHATILQCCSHDTERVYGIDESISVGVEVVAFVERITEDWTVPALAAQVSTDVAV